MAAVLPLGAVLAGRLLGDRIAAWTRAARRWFVPVLSVLTAGYLAALGFGAAQAPATAGNEPLARWLAAHGLTHGLASYWQANSATVASRGHVVVSAVVPDASGRLVPYRWERDLASYDRARHYANFVVTDGPAHGRACRGPRGSRSASRPGPITSTVSRFRSGTRTCWPSWTSRPEPAP